jgi:nitrate reductase gamma subunit
LTRQTGCITSILKLGVRMEEGCLRSVCNWSCLIEWSVLILLLLYLLCIVTGVFRPTVSKQHPRVLSSLVGAADGLRHFHSKTGCTNGRGSFQVCLRRSPNNILEFCLLLLARQTGCVTSILKLGVQMDGGRFRSVCICWWCLPPNGLQTTS